MRGIVEATTVCNVDEGIPELDSYAGRRFRSITDAGRACTAYHRAMSTTASELEAASFIDSAKSHGLDDGTIVGLLRNAGWSERRALRLLGRHYSETLGIAVPARAQSSEHAREAFYYLLNFITLGFWVTALGEIGYTLIAHWFPDAASAYRYGEPLIEQLSWQIATIVVAFPIFAFVHTLIGKALTQRPELYDSGVRKWLTYIALVIAAIVVIGDGVFFINGFLRGELTMRFVLDEILLFVLGGGVFAYYLATIDAPKTSA